MNTTRQLKKEEKRHNDIVNKLATPLSEMIDSFKFIEEKSRCYIPTDFEKSVEIANRQYNAWATKFNKKSLSKASFNAVRQQIAYDITQHELNLFTDLITEGINAKYGILAHDLTKHKGLIEESYVKGLSIEEAVVYLKTAIKK